MRVSILNAKSQSLTISLQWTDVALNNINIVLPIPTWYPCVIISKNTNKTTVVSNKKGMKLTQGDAV